MNSTTLTIRLPLTQRESLRQAAAALQKTESEYIRDLVTRDLENRPFHDRVGDLAGSLQSSGTPAGSGHPLKARIRSRNWRK